MVKNPPASARDAGSISGSGKAPVEGNPLRYSRLGNPIGRGAWQTTVYGVSEESITTWRLNQQQQINGKVSHVHGSETLILFSQYSHSVVSNSLFPKLIYRFNTIPIRI